MQKLSSIQTVASASLLAVMAFPLLAHADSNPFHMKDIAGYQVADAGKIEGKCGEGKCGAKGPEAKKAEGKCGEGKCGAKGQDTMKAEGKGVEGKCGASNEGKKAEGKCGEGKCGGNK